MCLYRVNPYPDKDREREHVYILFHFVQVTASLQQLGKENFFYKHSNRELKRRLRELGEAADQVWRNYQALPVVLYSG